MTAFDEEKFKEAFKKECDILYQGVLNASHYDYGDIRTIESSGDKNGPIVYEVGWLPSGNMLQKWYTEFMNKAEKDAYYEMLPTNKAIKINELDKSFHHILMFNEININDITDIEYNCGSLIIETKDKTYSIGLIVEAPKHTEEDDLYDPKFDAMMEEAIGVQSIKPKSRIDALMDMSKDSEPTIEIVDDNGNVPLYACLSEIKNKEGYKNE